MTDLPIEYLTDTTGNPRAVVIPIDLWRQRLPEETNSLEDLAGNLKDYCLNKAMDEAGATPLLDREAALKFLDAEDDD
jgi:hypothetical protein